MVSMVDHFASARYPGLNIVIISTIAFSGSTVNNVDRMFVVDYLP